MTDLFHNAGLRAVAVFLLCLLVLGTVSCSDSNPAGPDPGIYYPVDESSQLVGRWRTENMFASGLPIGGLLVPGATTGVADSRLSMFGTDLNISPSSQTTGVFSNDAQGASADTVDQSATASGHHRTVGGFTLWGEGQIEVLVTSENGKALPAAKKYLGTASTLGDTLLLEFRFATPPQKAVFFLPDTVSFLARLVRR